MKIALTGAIAGGKSTVVRTLRGLGWLTIETDRLAWEVANSPEGQSKMRELMGGDFLLADFKKRFHTQEDFRRAWEAFVHPRVNAAWRAFVADNGAANVAVELPLLYENKLEESFDKVVVLSTDASTARARWVAKGREASLFDALTNLLLPLADKISRADFVLDNNSTPDRLIEQIEALHLSLIHHNGQSL